VDTASAEFHTSPYGEYGEYEERGLYLLEYESLETQQL
jgi:hypothetical protein